MKKIVLFTLLFLYTTTVNATTLIKTVAMVNNDVVTSYQLDKKMATAMALETNRHQLSQEDHSALRTEVLNAMIEDLLVEQRIQELGLSVSDQDLESAIEDVQRQNKLTSEQLKAALQAQGTSYADYRKDLRKEILRYKLIAREVRSKVEVTKAEIRAYFSAHKADYLTEPTLRLGRISFPLPPDADAKVKERLIQKAQIARQQLLDGKPFAEVLKAQVDAEGGDMGIMVEEELNQHLHQMVNGLQTGQVSEPMETPDSVHVFQVLERSPAKAELTEDTRSQIEKILVAQNSEKRFSEWKKELRKDAIVDIRI